MNTQDLADLPLIALQNETRQLREAVHRLSRWVAKGIADHAFVSCVSPHAAEKDLAFASSLLLNAQSQSSSMESASRQRSDLIDTLKPFAAVNYQDILKVTVTCADDTLKRTYTTALCGQDFANARVMLKALEQTKL